MAVLGSTLLPLCLGMVLIAASSADYPERCMLFNAVRPTTTPGIQANTDVYKSGTVYTIFVPVNNNTISVVLRALDTNNSTVGLWDRADQYCNSSVLYYMKDMCEGFFRTSWQSPHSVNITTVEIQAFVINSHREATFSYLKLKKQGMTTTSPSMSSMTRPTTTRILSPTQSPTTTRVVTMARILNATSAPTTTKSLANRIFLSPITDAIQILLVFLASKLLF